MADASNVRRDTIVVPETMSPAQVRALAQRKAQAQVRDDDMVAFLHLHGSRPKIHDLELFQLQADQGPCLDCYATGQPISVADIQTEAARWPRFAAAATEAGFASVHAVPMRAASTVLGALGLFGTAVGELNDADRLVAQTLAHIACVAILQDHPATPATVLPHLHAALTSRIVVDQAKGFLSQRLAVSVDDAFTLLRRYARTHGDHLTELSRRLITEPDARQTILAAMTQMRGRLHRDVRRSGVAVVGHGRGAPPPGLGVARSRRVRRFRIADPPQPVESLLGAGHKRDASTAEAAGRVSAGRSVSFLVSQRVSQILGCRQLVRRYAYDGDARLRAGQHHRPGPGRSTCRT